jgi:hypothetical protein
MLFAGLSYPCYCLVLLEGSDGHVDLVGCPYCWEPNITSPVIVSKLLNSQFSLSFVGYSAALNCRGSKFFHSRVNWLALPR